jgi:hypothetical protein
MYRVFRYDGYPTYWPAEATVYIDLPNGSVLEYITDIGGTRKLVSGNGGAVSPWATLGDFPTTGTTEVLYIAEDTNTLYRWDGSTYVSVGGSSGGGGASNAIQTVTTNTSVTYTAGTNLTIFASGTINVTLPTAVSNRNYYTVVNTGTGVITVLFTGGQTCIGSSSVTLPIQNMSLTFISNNSNWTL